MLNILIIKLISIYLKPVLIFKNIIAYLDIGYTVTFMQLNWQLHYTFTTDNALQLFLLGSFLHIKLLAKKKYNTF